jgi:hypothetical protein
MMDAQIIVFILVLVVLGFLALFPFARNRIRPSRRGRR